MEVEIFVHVKNEGPMDGSESVLLFLKSPLVVIHFDLDV
mgnify:FL=1